MATATTAERVTLTAASAALGEELRATDDPTRQAQLRRRLHVIGEQLRATDRPRYIGSLTEVHGEVVGVRPCALPCCVGLAEWDHPHASLSVLPDAGGPVVRLDRVRFQSFTGRP